mmetsp:Transcript_4632/g.10796  ORF Transcript_4632/g.10796 Transcript_4632/m.10796 type:complete len:876 (-) Transcript_4632:249-2876(-)|eukprot:CAMPEP_0170597064 /NCGR_PEP_ID=MMETSP0224-20130122/15499_1 /TAXON_ID=285029 /ORGANISM="Togula jolla, Strain CCCM 725" /LENGTH=875 /DNA_ID=CAMNT_0010921493 /DNA_START=48 /DNA_END=2675 /DNA_ORIENTATION=-
MTKLFMDSWEAFFRGEPKDQTPVMPEATSGAPSPRTGSSPGRLGVVVEAIEENRINKMVAGFVTQAAQGTELPSDDELERLPSGGAGDEFLAPGRSVDLCKQLTQIFRDDPPVDCRRIDMAGRSCKLGQQYGKMAFSPAAVVRHLRLAKSFWDPSPKGNVQRLQVPPGSRQIIVGDTHGQLEDVLWIFFKYGLPSATNRYLFNGDIVDRGGHALEILLLLFAFKRDVPESLEIHRGNHEDVQCSLQFGFRSELESKFQALSGIVWNLACLEVFPLMPLASVVLGPLTGGRAFCVVHGGIPVDCPGQVAPVSLDDLTVHDRTRPTVQSLEADSYWTYLLFNLLWADPAESAAEKGRAGRGRGNKWIAEDTEAFCARNELAFVVRSHELPKNLRGAFACHGGRVFTLFSASNYCGVMGNRGGVFVCEVDGGLQMMEHWAPPWPHLANLIPENITKPSKTRAQFVREWEDKYDIVTPGEEGGSSSSGPRKAPETESEGPTSLDQLQRFMMEQLVLSKDKLVQNFIAADRLSSGLLPKRDFDKVFLEEFAPNCSQVLTDKAYQQLCAAWGLGETISYVRFLHRFQIRVEATSAEPTSLPQGDLMREASKLRKNLVDLPNDALERLLDPDGDKKVSYLEFAKFLPSFSLQVSVWQAAALYETMASFLDQDPLTLDDAVLCLAIMSRDVVPVGPWQEVSEKIGNEIKGQGLSFAGIFRQWDLDCSGYLSFEELAKGLRGLKTMKDALTSEVEDFMKFCESMGVANRRISMIEFVRAVAPRELAVKLQQSMIRETLKQVWKTRPALVAMLAVCDPRASNTVTIGEFRDCLSHATAQLKEHGFEPMSRVQVEVICELAAAGSTTVDYHSFMAGLHIVDTTPLI